jgi:hypothetical protein
MGSPDIEDDATAAAVALDQDALSSGAGDPTSSNGPRKKIQCQVRFADVTLVPASVLISFLKQRIFCISSGALTPGAANFLCKVSSRTRLSQHSISSCCMQVQCSRGKTAGVVGATSCAWHLCLPGSVPMEPKNNATWVDLFSACRRCQGVPQTYRQKASHTA